MQSRLSRGPTQRAQAMKCKLHICFDHKGNKIEKPKGILVDLNIDKDGSATAFSEDEKNVFRLERCHVEWAAALGLSISGVEVSGFSALKYHYQEWWCVTPTIFSDEVEKK